MPEDPEVERLLILARVGQTFNTLPSVVARALDEDPERIDIICASFLTYAQGKAAYDAAKGDEKKLTAYSQNLMDAVRRRTFDSHRQRLTHQREHKQVRDLECRFCRE